MCSSDLEEVWLGKLLVLVLIGAAIVILYRMGWALREKRRDVPADKGQAERMVACWCGVHIPTSLAYRDSDGRPACCAEHSRRLS